MFLPITLFTIVAQYVVETVIRWRDRRISKKYKYGQTLSIEDVFKIFSGSANDIYYMYRRENPVMCGWRDANDDWREQFNNTKNYLRTMKQNNPRRRELYLVYYLHSAWITLMFSLPVILGIGFVFATWPGGTWAQCIAIGFFVPTLSFVLLGLGYFNGNSAWSLRGLFLKYQVEPDDDIFVTYIKSIKEKACPLIEWVD